MSCTYVSDLHTNNSFKCGNKVYVKKHFNGWSLVDHYLGKAILEKKNEKEKNEEERKYRRMMITREYHREKERQEI